MAAANKTVLVTGGAGYIGSHVCQALAAAGYLPVTYDSMEHGHEWAVKWGPLEVGNVLDSVRLGKVMRQYMPGAVMHFAAYIAAGESVAEPDKYHHNNVVGSLSLLDSMRKNGVERLVFSSTAAVYGDPQQYPIPESHSLNPVNPYGETKLKVEQHLQELNRMGQLRYMALRYFNAAGADPGGSIGEAHHPETHLIPLVLDAAMGRREYIAIFGTDYDTPDGTCIRDYIHVNDIASAHVAALQALENGADSKAYNIGNGRGFSVMEVIESARRATGREILIRPDERRAGDPPRLVGDAGALKTELNWTPAHPDLDFILDSAWRWHQQHHSA